MCCEFPEAITRSHVIYWLSAWSGKYIWIFVWNANILPRLDEKIDTAGHLCGQNDTPFCLSCHVFQPRRVCFNNILLNGENLLKYWPRKRWWWKGFKKDTNGWINKYVSVSVPLAAYNMSCLIICINKFVNFDNYFLTAQPWAEGGSCSTLGYYYFFVGDQTQTSTRPTLNYAICNVYLPNLVSSGSTKISDYKVMPDSCPAKKSLKNPDFEVIYHFSVNSYLISAVVKSIP